jgi:integrase
MCLAQNFAVDHFIQHVLIYRNAPTVAQIVAGMLQDVAAAGRRERTLKDLRSRLGQFALTFGNRQLSTITLPELQAWLNDPALSARTRINYATKISQLYNYSIKRGWADTNLAERVARSTAEDSKPGILTVPQCKNLLERAGEFGLLPYVAIGLFAGLRAAELMRLDWPAVKLAERAIIVGADVAKK